MAQTCAWATDQIGQDSGLSSRLYVLEYLLSRRGTGPYRVERECKMTTKTKTHNLQFDGFCVKVEREMTNAEMAEYFRGIAEMFEEQADDGYYGLPECNIKLTFECK